jgi:L-amino acid N-acyltransferase YncA
MENIRIVDTNAENIHEYGMCGYKNLKYEGYKKKIEWVKKRFFEGMRYKILYSEKEGAIGGIEYIPGEYSWRPIDATGYMVIHCIYIIPKLYKQKGYGTQLLLECINDAKKEKLNGVAIVTRDGTWMAGKELFLKNKFEIVDEAPSDFELLAMKFDKNAINPKFKGDWESKRNKYNNGLVMIASDQCPYIEKALNEIGEKAESEYGIKMKVIKYGNYKDVQNSPCAFGTFCMLYKGVVITDHPISQKRFTNIMNKILKK